MQNTDQERDQITEHIDYGCMIIKSRKIDPINSVCVVHRPNDKITPYVRWWFNHQSPGFFWGHCHTTEQAAIDDLDETVHGGSYSAPE